MDNADELLRTYKRAQERINKIGAPEPHFKPVSHGGLTSVTVKTTICHQASSGAKNYWDDEEFDAALALVIKSNFSDLAQKALARMKADADAALLKEESDLRARLAAIDAIKAQGVQQ